jgi:phage/plasmid-associated DNA primase
MTGRDTILVERKFKDQFNYRPIAKFIFSANKPPRVNIDTTDLAFWKRFLIIPFVGRFTKAVEDFELTLMDEAPSILALAIAAFLRVKARGFLFTGDPPSLEELAIRNRNLWLSRFDTVYQFLTWALREGVLVRDDAARVPTTRGSEKEGKSLYEFYAQYTEARNLEPVAANRFTGRLRELGLPLSRPKGVYYLKGFKIDEDAFAKAIEKIKGSELPNWFLEALNSGGSSTADARKTGVTQGTGPEVKPSQSIGLKPETTEPGLGKPPEPKAQEPVNVDELLRSAAEEANNRLKARWPNADYKDIVEGLINYIAGEGEVDVDKLVKLYWGAIADRLKEAGYSEAELEDDVHEFIKIVIDVLKENGVVTDA